MKNLWLGALTALLVLAGWSGYAQPQNAAKTQWDYLVVQGVEITIREQRLNELGAQGWELVSVTFTCLSNLGPCYTAAYMKRAKQ
jgi:hypothetical protein